MDAIDGGNIQTHTLLPEFEKVKSHVCGSFESAIKLDIEDAQHEIK